MTAAAAETTAGASRSYAAGVWRQLSVRPAAQAGLALMAVFFLLAFLAPLLAQGLPFWWQDAQGVSSPLGREFFAPSGTTEPLLEKAFNYLLLFLPLAGLARRWGPCAWRRRLTVGAALIALLPFLLISPRNDPTPYRELAASGQGRGWFTLIPYGPRETGFGPHRPPTWWAGETKAASSPAPHWLGTDAIGRDVCSRVIHGARVSLAVGFVAVAIATLIGLALGASAGYFGGRVDLIISRAIEIMICFPTFFLILTVIAVLDKRSILNIMLVIGFTGWTGVARLVRGEVLKQRALDYVAAARALGVSSARIIFRHILPNALAPVLVSVTFDIAGAILTEAGLSFLGFGVAPPTPTWGMLLNEARQNGPLDNWWLVLFPGLLLFLSVTAYNLVGEALRDALDPRQRGIAR